MKPPRKPQRKMQLDQPRGVEKFFRKFVRDPMAHAPTVSWGVPFEAIVAIYRLWLKDSLTQHK